jgi:hypothetical protein
MSQQQAQRSRAACITKSAAPNLTASAAPFKSVSRGGIELTYHDVARARQRAGPQSFERHGNHHSFPKTDSSNDIDQVQA